MNKTTYDIFISYRREGGFETASLIAEKLRNAGYSVFFDLESLRAGKFNEQLLRVIENCKDFIIVLPKDALDRCMNETDWVRQEIIHAMKHGKNVIPVMLSGFQWLETMPAGLEGLKNYQSVLARNHEHFNASMDTLKSFLKSKKGFTWRRYKTYIISAMLLLSIATGVFLWNEYKKGQEESKKYQNFTLLCIDQTNLMSVGIVIVNHNLNIAESAYDEWNKFRNKLSRTKPQDIPVVKQEFIAWIENQKKSIQSPKPELKISDATVLVLNNYDIKTSEITGLYMTLPLEVENVTNYLDQLQNYANEGVCLETFDKFLRLQYQSMEASGKAIYYYFLGLLSAMPENVYRDFNKIRQNLNHFSEIPLKMSPEEYEYLGDDMSRKMEDFVSKMDLVDFEECIKDMIQDLFVMKEEEEIAARTQNIQILSADVIEQRKQLQEIEEKNETILRNIIEQCKLSPEDGQYLMWGKIIRIATRMERTAAYRREYENLNKQNKEAAQAKGYDLSNGFEVKYTLSTDEILREITTRLDQYMQYFPETKNYVPAVKQFYTDVKDGKQNLCGMVIMGTKDDVPHPVFKAGDIMLSRKGKTTNSMEDYESAAQEEGDNTVVFLRLNGGKLQKHTEVIPKADVLVGFLVLREE